jgi:ElaB/YqjD/DUF883 family membrane-anchored ribosome-binding protein
MSQGINEMPGEAADPVDQVSRNFQEGIETIKQRTIELKAALAEQTRALCQATDTRIRANPWQSVGIAAGVGLLLGILARRR